MESIVSAWRHDKCKILYNVYLLNEFGLGENNSCEKLISSVYSKKTKVDYATWLNYSLVKKTK